MNKEEDEVMKLVGLAEQRLSELKELISQYGINSMEFRVGNSMVMVPLKIIDEVIYGPNSVNKRKSLSTY